MVRQALSLYRRRFGALVLIGALAIAPASLLEGGSLHAVLPRLSSEDAPRPEKQPRPQGDAARLQRFDFSKVEPAPPFEAVRASLPLLYGTFLGALLLAAGACLALAAISAAVVDENFSPAH